MIIDFILMFLIVFFGECLITIIVGYICHNPKDRKMVASLIQVTLTTLICLKALGRI